MKEEIMINLLKQVKEVLDELDIEFWLDCGTLLGFIREGRFLSWENDIDLGVWYKSFSENLKILVSNKLYDRGFKVHIYENYMNIRRGEVCADINFYHLNNDKAICYQLIDPLYKFLNYFLHVLSNPYDYEVYKEKSLKKRFIMWLIIRFSRIILPFLRKYMIKIIKIIYKKIKFKGNLWEIPVGYFINLSTIKLYGMELKVPTNTEEYLIYRYGKDWQVPKRDWVTARDDGTVKLRF